MLKELLLNLNVFIILELVCVANGDSRNFCPACPTFPKQRPGRNVFFINHEDLDNLTAPKQSYFSFIPSKNRNKVLKRPPRQINIKNFLAAGNSVRRRPPFKRAQRNFRHRRKNKNESHKQVPGTRTPVVYPQNTFNNHFQSSEWPQYTDHSRYIRQHTDQSTQNFHYKKPRKKTIIKSHQKRPLTRKPVFKQPVQKETVNTDFRIHPNPVLESGRLVSRPEIKQSERLQNHNFHLADTALNSISTLRKPRRGRKLHENIFENIIPHQRECGISQNAQSRVLGGLDAGYGQFPWAAIVTVTGEDIDKMCTGTLISDRFVMTAGHCTSYCKQIEIPECTRPIPADDLTFKITLGEYDYKTRNLGEVIEKYYAVNLFLHPRYKSNLSIRSNGFVESDPHYDIALLKLDRRVKPSQYISPICLPVNSGLSSFPGRGTVIGWGRVGRFAGDPHSSVLQAATVPILTREECSQMEGASVPSEDQLCAGISYADTSACPGDSGGGLMSQNTEGQWFILGIVSTGAAECGLTPVIFHNVTHTLDWIQSITNDFGA